jgi:chromosome segregation ATPase
VANDGGPGEFAGEVLMSQIMHASLALGFCVIFTACTSTYYKTMEVFGQHKRDLLVDAVAVARDDQEQAKRQFKTALERFREVVQVEGGALEANYKQLNTELKRCEAEADDVRGRIRTIESVAEDLFEEWERELDQYSSPDLRRSSESKLRETRQRADDLIGAMKRAENKMEPVLTAFRDQVLFLKHNLNAQAIASLGDEAASLEQDVARLIAEMEASIAEANAFIDAMGSS